MDTTQVTLSDKERAYVQLLSNHVNMFKALLTDMAGPAPGPDMPIPITRELALANTRLEEAFYHAREHVFRTAMKSRMN